MQHYRSMTADQIRAQKDELEACLRKMYDELKVTTHRKFREYYGIDKRRFIVAEYGTWRDFVETTFGKTRRQLRAEVTAPRVKPLYIAWAQNFYAVHHHLPTLQELRSVPGLMSRQFYDHYVSINELFREAGLPLTVPSGSKAVRRELPADEYDAYLRGDHPWLTDDALKNRMFRRRKRQSQLRANHESNKKASK